MEETAPRQPSGGAQGRDGPLRRLSARKAFADRKSNPFGVWPHVDDPDNRFAILAAPSYRSSFTLVPGQKIFTIGSCFARNIEAELANRGFDVPARSFAVDKREWSRDPSELLNNYVPGSIAPQIRWAFGLEKFDIDLHAVEVRPGRYLDPYLAPSERPIPLEEVAARRESLGALYRQLATSDAVILTLGYVEAWFDQKSGNYVNAPPPIAILRRDPDRFEMHVLDYAQVYASLVELIELLNRVCPKGYRIILTVSPAPLHLTFTDDDIAVANMYSKSVLRAAAGALCARHLNIDYFPSYESFMLSPRNIAFGEDQIHVSDRLVRFNVDRMLQQYLKAESDSADAAEIVAAARKEQAQGHYGSAFMMLKSAWGKNRADAELTVALARMYHAAGVSGLAERMLSALLKEKNNLHAMVLLASICNKQGRHAEAAAFAEKVAATGKLKMRSTLERAEAYFNLERYEEGYALLSNVAAVDERNGVKVSFWKARFLEKLQRFHEAEELHKQCNCEVEEFEYLFAYAQFLAARGRRDEARQWIRRAIIKAPYELRALNLLRSIEGARDADASPSPSRFGFGPMIARARRLIGLS